MVPKSMGKRSDFYTETMARVYAKQGHWQKAAEIYRYLLEQEPGRRDYSRALEEVESKLVSAAKTPDDLVPLFREWLELMGHYIKLERLSRLKRRS
jgi:pentatricopeptide repeat protein